MWMVYDLCDIGHSFILGFLFPPLWYYATFLYIRNYHDKDPRERPGLAASAIAALIFTAGVLAPAAFWCLLSHSLA
ncbi:hypothetical protein L1049_021189 [Liquidambar formosana]|uniref:Uncharacterized protein n=1 Tax=Liquidambar formosana TaxID=63359 RepID=A0AAP0XB70_LIQFO